MRISHPQAPYQGVARENVFFVANDQQIQMGTGYVVPFMQGEMYPERPLHLFMQIDAQPSARAMMYGALLARADQLRSAAPHLPARLYAQVPPENLELIHFYESCGFKNDDGEDLYRFPVPQGFARAPMGIQLNSVPLMDEPAKTAFLNRLNLYRIQPFTGDYLTLWQQQPHFLALGFYRGGVPVSEILLTGAGENATLLMVYTRSDYRRQGLARQLIDASCAYLREQGVTTLYTHIFRRNAAQQGLMRHYGASFIRNVMSLPGLDL